MGNTESRNSTTFEGDERGKFFTTSDGVRLSCSMIKRLSTAEKERDPCQGSGDAQQQAQDTEETAKINEKLIDLERSQMDTHMQMEFERQQTELAMTSMRTLWQHVTNGCKN